MESIGLIDWLIDPFFDANYLLQVTDESKPNKKVNENWMILEGKTGSERSLIEVWDENWKFNSINETNTKL